MNLLQCAMLLVAACGSKPATALNMAHAASAFTDTWTTQRQSFYIQGGKRVYLPVHEFNPLARPFMTNGKPLAYISTYWGSVGASALSFKMRASKNRVISRIWWLPQVGLIVGHSLAARHNVARYERDRPRGW